MPLSPAQLATLKADILANTATIPAGYTWTGAFAGVQVKDVPNNGDGNLAIAGWYSLDASPTYYGWKSSQSRADNRRAVMNTAGAGNQMDGLTAGKRECLIFGLDDTIDCRLASVRTTIEDWCGSQNTLKAAIIDSFKRALKRIEKLFATGTGAFATPSDVVYEGSLSSGDVESARNLP